MPEDYERCELRPVHQLTLETKEEVQAFFNALGKLHNGDSVNNERIV